MPMFAPRLTKPSNASRFKSSFRPSCKQTRSRDLAIYVLPPKLQIAAPVEPAKSRPPRQWEAWPHKGPVKMASSSPCSAAWTCLPKGNSERRDNALIHAEDRKNHSIGHPCVLESSL